MIGDIRVNIVGTRDPMLSISVSDPEGVACIEFFGEEIEELRAWLNSQISPKEADSYFKLGPEEWAAIEAIEVEDVSDEMGVE